MRLKELNTASNDTATTKSKLVISTNRLVRDFSRCQLCTTIAKNAGTKK
ncbi:hypothetical protein imdm_2323 [gamma proteobacterium IMCC2047]|nr:hypothetical protein imdm_2323 [gamma proteobacterium IMCC2047]